MCKAPIPIVQACLDSPHKKAMVHRVMMMAISPIFDPEQWVLWEVDHIARARETTLYHNNDILNLRWLLPVTNKMNYHGKNQMNKKKKSIG